MLYGTLLGVRKRRKDWKGERVVLCTRIDRTLDDTIRYLARRADMTVSEYVYALLRHVLMNEKRP